MWRSHGLRGREGGAPDAVTATDALSDAAASPSAPHGGSAVPPSSETAGAQR